MEGENGDFHDWELLPNSSDSGSVNSSDSVVDMRVLQGFGGESEGMIRTDYFSIDQQKHYLVTAASDEGSVESDNTGWVDPESQARYLRKESHELSPHSGSDNSKFREFGAKNELGFVGIEKTSVGFEGKAKIGAVDELSLGSLLSHEPGFVGNVKEREAFEGIGESGSDAKDLVTSWSDSSGSGRRPVDFVEVGQDYEMGKGSEEKSHDGKEVSDGENNNDSSDGLASRNQSGDEMGLVKSGGQREKKNSVVWWKVPFELLKFCAFRVSPVWTFSMAAAVMGLVMLSSRLYKMKKKSQALQLKVTMDDKKASQFMSRAARLNEAFSMVRRFPVTRPVLPAAGGLTQWPLISPRLNQAVINN